MSERHERYGSECECECGCENNENNNNEVNETTMTNEQEIKAILMEIKAILDAQAQWMTSNVVDKINVGGNTININVGKNGEVKEDNTNSMPFPF